MHSDLERLLLEDETARAGLDAARSRARAQLETVRGELSHARTARLRQLQEEVDQSVARILAEGDREVERRRAQREAHAREHAERTALLIDRGVEEWMHVVRKGDAPRGSP